MLSRLLAAVFVSATFGVAGPKVHTLEVGKNPESVTRGWSGDLFVTIMGERGDHPDAATDSAIHRVDADGVVSPFLPWRTTRTQGDRFHRRSLGHGR